MKKIIIAILILSANVAFAAPSTNALLFFDGTNFSATSSPTVGYVTATSTATSTFPRASFTTGISILGEYFENFTNYVRSLFSQGTGITISSGSIAATLGTSITVGELASADFGDWTCNGSSCTVDSNSIALTTDTTGNYVSSATANKGLTLTGTEGASLGLIDCSDGEIIKNSGGTNWICAADNNSGGGGSGNVATSTAETAGQLPYWTSTSATPATLGKVATTTLTATSPLALSQPISVIGSSASALSIGNIPVTNLNSGTGASASTFWRGDATWAIPSGGSGGTGTSTAPYVFGFINVNPSDATTYYIGSRFGTAPSTSEGLSKQYVTASGTITSAYVLINDEGVTGSNETSTMSVRVNGTTDYTISSAITVDGNPLTFSNAAMSVPVVPGDYFEIKWVTPTWATNPTTVRVHGILGLSSPGTPGSFGNQETMVVAISDETSSITTGTAKVTFHMPYAFNITKVKAGLTASSTSGAPAFDLNDDGVSVFSTTVTVDALEFFSDTAATPPVLTSTPVSVAAGSKMTIDIDTAGTGAKGAKLYIIGYATAAP